MATAPEAPPAPRPDWLQRLDQKRRETAIGLLVLGVALAAIPVYIGYRFHWDYLPISLWGALLSLVALGAGAWHLTHQPNPEVGEAAATRFLVLSLGGLAGLFTVVFIGLALPYFEWWSVYTGGLASWRQNWPKVMIPAVSLVGGLALVFASVQLARGQERSNPTLRRLLYGYNAVLTGLLLLAILAVVNVLTYVRVPPFSVLGRPSDWTESNIYTLSTGSRNLLASLDKPVKVYVLLREGLLRREVETLLDNCRNVSNKIEVEYVSPDRQLTTVAELARRYQLTETEGLLVVYGTPPGEQHEFIRADELATQGDERDRFEFTGENALITKLTYLAEGKSRSTVYFTQGNGELDLNDSSTASRDAGAGLLKERLQKANYDVKPLDLGPTTERVPADASVVVIARPSRPLADAALNALRGYLNPTGAGAKKGKLVILFDVVVGRDGAMVTTGLERLVGEYTVQVGNNRVLVVPNNLTGRAAADIPVFPASSTNPLAQAFSPQDAFVFSNARTVQPSTAPNPAGRATADTILSLPARMGWAETNLQADPVQLMRSLLSGPDARTKVLAKISQQPLSVAVTVTEPKASAANDPHAFMQGQDPRLAVFGDASWVTNQNMVETRNTGGFELFASTLSWLRERPDIGTKADPKVRKAFKMTADPEAIGRLWILPAFMLLVAIVALGGGLWLVRRR